MAAFTPTDRPETDAAVIRRLVREYAETMGGYGKAPRGAFRGGYLAARAEAEGQAIVRLCCLSR